MVTLPLLLALTGIANAEPVLTHQGRALDAQGVPVEGPADIQIRLFDEVDSATPFWDRTFEDVAVQQGYYALTLLRDGQNRPLDPVVLADGETWLDVTIGEAVTPKQRLGSTPHALSVAPTLATAGQACSTAGVLAYEAATHTLLACTGSVFTAVGVSGGSTSPVIASCADMTDPGLYTFSPETGDDFEVWCDLGPDGLPMTLIASFVATSDSATQVASVAPETVGTLEDAKYQALLASLGPSEVVVAGTHSGGTSYMRARMLGANCVAHTTTAVPIYYSPLQRAQYSWNERSGCNGSGQDYSFLVLQNSPNQMIIYDYGSYYLYDYWVPNTWSAAPGNNQITVASGITRFYTYLRPLQ